MCNDIEVEERKKRKCTPEKHLCICDHYICCECLENKRSPTDDELVQEELYKILFRCQHTKNIELMRKIIEFVKNSHL